MNAPGLIFISLLFLLASFVGAYKGAAKAFIYVFIPVIFLTPGSVYVKLIEGIPRLTPVLFVTLPILIMYIVNRSQTTKINFVDFLVVCYLGSIFLSNLSNNGYWDAQHNLFNDIWRILLPYIFAKNLIHPHGYSYSLAKCIVVMAMILSVFGLIEFFTGKSIFIYLYWRLFADQVVSSTSSRIGFFRVVGTYGHPIVLGTALGMCFSINRWVQAMHKWKPQKFRNFENIKGWYFTVFTLLGTITTLSRGPLLATGFGYVISGFYKVASVKKSILRLIIVLIAAWSSYKLFEWYTSVSADQASDLQIPIIYRQRLYDLYFDLISQRPFLGWGTYMPVVQGFESIDNGFIYQTMINGLLTLFVFLTLYITVAFRLFFAGLSSKATFDKKALSFTLLGTFVVYIISYWTAALQTDNHLNCFLFTLFGWSEGVLAWRNREAKYVELRN